MECMESGLNVVDQSSDSYQSDQKVDTMVRR